MSKHVKKEGKRKWGNGLCLLRISYLDFDSHLVLLAGRLEIDSKGVSHGANGGFE